jgi:hypothetical protein
MTVRNNIARTHARSTVDAYFFLVIGLVLLVLLISLIYSFHHRDTPYQAPDFYQSHSLKLMRS